VELEDFKENIMIGVFDTCSPNADGIIQTKSVEDGVLRRILGAHKENVTKRLQNTAL
jgi:hypothetical protein